MAALEAVHRHLDGVVRPRVRVGDRTYSAFQLCGSTGLTLAVAVGVLLTLRRGLSLWVLAAMVLTAVATFLALAMITKIVVGEEILVYYHHEVAILATVTLILWLSGQSVLSYLDVTILGIGTFLVFGRVGCFMVGCCHGRPHCWGVAYRAEHAADGFPSYYVGVRLLPIQLIESAWVLVAVSVGIWLVVSGAEPGAALVWYVIVYDVGRFGFEFARGDPSRPFWGGFSEGQWTSLLLMLIVVAAECVGAVPLHRWHLATTGGVVLAMLWVTVRWRLHGDRRYRLLGPDHVREVAQVLHNLDEMPTAPTEIAVATTSAGLRLSTGRANGVRRHYTFSSTAGVLTEADARAVADRLAQLKHHDGPTEFVPGRAGVFHLIAPLRELPLGVRAP
jgi:hypothetical protein